MKNIDEWLVIQVFPTNVSLNVSLLKPTVKFCECFIRQSFSSSKFCAVQYSVEELAT